MSYNGDGNETKEGLHRDVVHQPILVVEQRAPLGWYEIVLIVHGEPATFQVYRSTQRYIFVIEILLASMARWSHSQN